MLATENAGFLVACISVGSSGGVLNLLRLFLPSCTRLECEEHSEPEQVRESDRLYPTVMCAKEFLDFPAVSVGVSLDDLPTEVQEGGHPLEQCPYGSTISPDCLTIVRPISEHCFLSPRQAGMAVWIKRHHAQQGGPVSPHALDVPMYTSIPITMQAFDRAFL